MVCPAEQPVTLDSNDVTPEMIECGVRKFREWENRFFDVMDGYPPLDCDLRHFLPELFSHMRGMSKTPSKKDEQFELRVDAQERFERAVDAAIKSGPKHRQPKLTIGQRPKKKKSK